MNKWVLRVSSLIVAVLLLLMGTTAVMAAGADQSDQTMMFLVEVTVQDDGQWILGRGGMDMGLDSANFNSLSQRLGLGLASPVVDPSLLQMAADADVQDLAVVKEGAQTAIWVNGEPLTALTVTDSAVMALTEAFAPELEGLLSWVNATYMTAIIHLPGSSGAQAMDMTKTLGAADMAEPKNVIKMGATVSPQGEVISVGGLAFSDLGIMAPMVDISLAGQLGINQVDLDLGMNGVSIAANSEEWVSLAWNPDMLMQKAPAAYKLSGMQYRAQDEMVLDTATSWLKDTHISASVYVGTAPKDEALTVSIGRPVVLEVGGDGVMSVEGFAIGMLDASTKATVEGLKSAAVMWDGAKGEFRLATGNKPLPYLKVDQGFLPQAVDLLAGGQDLGLPVSLGFVENLLGNTKFSVGIVAEGNEPPAMSEYEAKPSQPVLLMVPQIKVAPNGIAVFGEALPVSLVDSLSGMDIGGWTKLYADAFAGNALDLKLGPSGLDLTVNGKNAGLRWDNTLRNNLVDIVIDQGGPSLGLPANIDSGLVKTLAKAVLGVVNQAEIGVELDVTAEALEPGFVQTIVGWIFPGM
jgi:hypothetical protein